MPRIPVIEGQSVQSRGLGSVSRVGGDGTPGAMVARAGDALGRSVGGGINDLVEGENRRDAEAKRIADEAKAKARAVSRANADAELQRNETQRLVGGSNRERLINDAFNGDGPSETLTPANVKSEPGYYATRGMAASEKAADAYDGLEKDRQGIAKRHFVDEESRQDWLNHSAGFMAGADRKVQTHAARQFEVAQEEALKGKVAESLLAIGNSADGHEFPQTVASVEKSLRELGSKESADAAVAAWREQAVAANVQRLLNRNDATNARDFLDNSDGMLTANGKARLEHAVASAEKAAGVKANDIEAQQRIDAILRGGVSMEGRPDLAAIDKEFLAVPAGPLRDEMAQRIGPAKERAAQEWKQKVDNYANAASSTFEKTLNLGAVDPKVKNWLIDNAPDEWRKLRHDAQARTNHSRAIRTGDAAARREQENVDRLAMSDFRNLSVEERAGQDVQAFLRGRGASPLGSSLVGAEKTRAQATVKAGDAQNESEFVRLVEASTRGLAGKDKEMAKDIKAQAVKAYGDLRERAKGKPSSADADTEIERLTAAAATAPRIGETFRGKGVETEIQRRIREQKASKGKVTAAASPMIPVVTATGAKGSVPEAKLAAWLAAHPGAKRAQ